MTTINPTDLRPFLSNFLSAFSETSRKKFNINSLFVEPTVVDVDILLKRDIKSHLRSVKFGTGLGKSYGVTEQYINFGLIRGYIGKDRKNTYRDFANLIFSVPTKELFSFSEKHLNDFEEYDITPVSVLAVDDCCNYDFKVWASRDHITMKRRLDDFAESLRHIRKLAAETDNKKYIRQINYMLNVIQSMIENITYIRKTKNRVDILKSKGEKDEANILESSIKRVKSSYQQSYNCLVTAILGNHSEIKTVKSIKKDQQNNAYEQTVNDKQTEGDDAVELYYDYQPLDDSDLSPYNEQDVFDKIFSNAYKKSSFDNLIAPLIKKENDFNRGFATFKKDFLRIYAPLDYASYVPCVIMLTHDKLITAPSMHHYNKNGWQQIKGFKNFFQMLGNKERYDEMISYKKDDEQKAFLDRTLFKHINLHHDLKPKKVDYATSFENRNIENFIVIDECNVLFEKMFQKSLKSIFKDTSITDLVANANVIFKNYDEIIKDPDFDPNCPPDNIFYYEHESFCRTLEDFYEKHKFIDEGVAFNPTLRQAFEIIRAEANIIYSLPSETDTVVNLAKNSFSISPKLFINKKSLLQLKITKKFNEVYITSKTNKPNLSLYNYYILVLAILYASHNYIEKSERTKKFKEQATQLPPSQVRREITQYIGGMYKVSAESQTKFRNLGLLAQIMSSDSQSKLYVDFLDSDEIIDEDLDADTWFSYVQSFMIFGLIPTDFGDEMKDKSARKTFYDLHIYRRDSLPELEVLKCLVNTKTRNYLYLMSATSGQQKFTFGQFNNAVLKKYAALYNIPLFESESDMVFNVDYRQLSETYLSSKKLTRKCNIVIYDKTQGILPRLVTGRALQEAHDFIRDLQDYQNKIYSYTDSTNKAYIYRNTLGGALAFMLKHETFLSMAINSSAFVTMRNYVRSMFTMQNFERSHKQLMLNHIRLVIESKGTLTTPLIFQHSDNRIGRISFPLFNEYIWKQYEAINRRSNTSKEADDDYAKDNDISKIYELIKSTQTNSLITNIVDFIDLHDRLQKGITKTNIKKVNRLVLFNKELRDWQGDLSQYYVTEQRNIEGIGNCLIKTGFISYFAAVDTGVNLSVRNSVDYSDDGVAVVEDIKNLLIVGFDYYNSLESKENKINAILLQGQVYLRNIGDVHNQGHFPKVSQLDDDISSFEASKMIKREVLNHQYNGIMQKIGRVERNTERMNKYGEIFTNNIYIDNEAVDMCAMAIMNRHKLDSQFEPKENKNSYHFQSYNNRVFYETVIDTVKSKSLPNDARARLESDTLEASEKLKEFCEVFITKLTSDIRKKHDDDYVEFDLKYRSTNIIENPKVYIKDLLATNLAKKSSYVRNMVELMGVDLSKYSQSPADIFVFKDGSNYGLTDFTGNESCNRSCTKAGYFIQELTASDKFNPALVNGLKDVVENYNRFSRMHYTNFIIHPYMHHMVIANIGEQMYRVFRRNFMNDSYYIESTNVIEQLGYAMHEQSDDWILRQHWIAVDVKTMSHYENLQSTKSLFDKQDRKISNHFNMTDKAFAVLLDNHCEISLINLNIRANLNNAKIAINSTRDIDVVIKEKPVTVHVKNINLFTRVCDNPYDNTENPKVTFSDEVLAAFNLKP